MRVNKQLTVSSHWDREIPKPQLGLRVDTDTGIIAVENNGNDVATIPLSLGTIHSLFDSIDGQLLLDGISLKVTEKSIATPLGFEALLQIIMMNMVSCVFPRINMTFSSPLRSEVTMHSLDAETNYIRNAAIINDLNHVHILKDRLAGLPLLVALPGPSLDIEYIREHKKKFILLAVGRAVGKLFEAGIHPDFVFIQDVNQLAWDKSLEMLGDTKTPSTLIANPLGRIWKYAKNFKRVFKAWNLYPFEVEDFPKIEEIAPSSVSGAYSVARLLGCSPIVFLGNDCGVNVAKPDTMAIPERLTNLQYEKDGDSLVFMPLKKMDDIRLSFGDEFSVATQNDYIAGSQWLKIRATQDARELGQRIYDNSQTRLVQFNSPIQNIAKYKPGNQVVLPDLPEYKTNYDLQKYLRHKKHFYSFIKRQIEVGCLPKSVFSRPGSSVLTGTIMAYSDSQKPQEDDMEVAAINARTLVEHADAALRQL